MRASGPALLLAALLLAAPSFADAEQLRGRVAVIAVAGSQEPRSAAEASAERLQRRLEGIDLLGPDSARELFSAASSARAEATRLAARAHAEVETFADLETAARLLDQAVEAHLAILPLLESLDEVLRLLVDLATVALALGDGARVDAALATAVRLDPAFDLDPDEVSSRLVQAAATARQSHDAEPLLAPERVREWAGALGVDWILLVQPRPGPRPILVELYGRRGDREQRFATSMDDIGEVATGLTGSAEHGRAAPSETSAPTPEVQSRRSIGVAQPTAWYRRWWVWTVVGAVVAAAAAAGAVAAVYSGAEPDLDLEVRRRW